MHTTKLTKIGNSTGVTLPREVLSAAGLRRGDEVAVEVRDNRVEISKSEDPHNRAMEIGRKFIRRYARAMDILSR